MFEPHGQVDRVSIMTDRDTGRSRGFGFVEMASNEDGEKAITALNGSQVGGRAPQRKRGPSQDRARRRRRTRPRWHEAAIVAETAADAAVVAADAAATNGRY